MDKWVKRWFELADLAASWSQDPSTKVGCVLLPADSDIPIIGWNGFPRGVDDKPERYANRELKLKLIIHAEANVLLNATRHGINTWDSTLYIRYMPCVHCACQLIQAGVKHIVISKKENQDFDNRWGCDNQLVQEILKEAHVNIHWKST